MVRYHEGGRFCEKDDDWDRESAVFHLELAANLGELEAIVGLGLMYSQLPHHILADVSVKVRGASPSPPCSPSWRRMHATDISWASVWGQALIGWLKLVESICALGNGWEVTVTFPGSTTWCDGRSRRYWWKHMKKGPDWGPRGSAQASR